MNRLVSKTFGLHPKTAADHFLTHRATLIANLHWLRLCRSADGLLDIKDARKAVQFLIRGLGGDMIFSEETFTRHVDQATSSGTTRLTLEEFVQLAIQVGQ